MLVSIVTCRYMLSLMLVSTSPGAGIYSDVHMLALMYAGEMCYWYWELDRGGSELVKGPPTTVNSAGEVVSSTCVLADARSRLRSEDKSGSGTGAASGSAMSESGTSPFGLMGSMRGLDFVREWREGFNPAKLGVDYLTKYIDAARGPLKLQQWNYDRAIHLLIRLKKSLS